MIFDKYRAVKLDHFCQDEKLGLVQNIIGIFAF